MPPFDLSDSGGAGLVLLRGCADLSCLGLFGTAVLRLWVAPAGLALMTGEQAAEARRLLRRATSAAAIAALLSLLLWLVFTARFLAGATSLAGTLAAAALVLGDLRFGHAVIGQGLALTAVLACARGGSMPARAGLLVAATLLLLLQACHGHAFAMGDGGLSAIACLHLLAGGAWLGGLPALLALSRRAPPAAALALCQAFSPLGQIAVLLIAVSALLQGLVMIGTTAALFHTAYGWTALAKAALFALLLVSAAINRFWATPRLRQAESGRRLLQQSLAVEIAVGIIVILAAALLASLPPVMPM